jgi:GTPase SAR1 family protein
MGGKNTKDKIQKMIFLGMGCGGKTTLIQNLSRIGNIEHGDDFRSTYISPIRISLLVFTQKILESESQQNNLKIIELIKSNENITNFYKIKPNEFFTMKSSDIINNTSIIDNIWKDERMKECRENLQSIFKENENIKFFIEKLDQIKKENWKPSDDDILCSRNTTSGTDDKFFLKKPNTQQKIFMIDVGGQKNERNKWNAIIDENHPKLLMYIVSLSDFENMDESLKTFIDLYEKVSKDMKTILVFNKMDILKKRLGATDDAGKEKIKEFIRVSLLVKDTKIITEDEKKDLNDLLVNLTDLGKMIKFIRKRFLGICGNNVKFFDTTAIDRKSVESLYSEIFYHF